MIRFPLKVTLITVVCLFGCAAFAQNRPAFCDQVQDSLLGGLQAPYAKYTTPDGKSYCEGLLVKPIAMLPPSIVSLKQFQVNVPPFASGTTASLNWCDEPSSPLHVRLRSAKIPLFGLDALEAGNFKWRTDLIATWQPSWNNIAAIGTREVTVAGQKYTVFVPLRVGKGYSNIYSFMIESHTPISMSKALIQPIQPSGNSTLADVTFTTGPSKNTWLASVSFATLKAGIYRVTLEEAPDDAGVATTPIYLLHKTCTHE